MRVYTSEDNEYMMNWFRKEKGCTDRCYVRLIVKEPAWFMDAYRICLFHKDENLESEYEVPVEERLFLGARVDIMDIVSQALPVTFHKPDNICIELNHGL
jgi:hypothetical protein